MPVAVEKLAEFLAQYDPDTPVYLTLEEALRGGTDDFLSLDLAMDELILQAAAEADD